MNTGVLDQIIDLADQLTMDERVLLIERLKHKGTAKTIVRLGGSWAKYQIDSDEVENALDTLRAERQAATERTLRQINGDFDDD